ncbi:MAG: hypothetical protein Q4E58_11375 [Prevotellaceae bacterium]|nr:hypothetical protein [Prevotellaceae bacterium]
MGSWLDCPLPLYSVNKLELIPAAGNLLSASDDGTVIFIAMVATRGAILVHLNIPVPLVRFQ